MGSRDLAHLYFTQAFPYIGILSQLISDRDMRFTSQMFKEICDLLKIKQNISSAYHPQTDGQSKRTNQNVEVMLCIFGNHRQDDWCDWLPMVQYVINVRCSESTKQVPYETWMGCIPRSHQPERPSRMPEVQKRKEILIEARQQATLAMKHAMEL